jgi:hypothetical protein
MERGKSGAVRLSVTYQGSLSVKCVQTQEKGRGRTQHTRSPYPTHILPPPHAKFPPVRTGSPLIYTCAVIGLLSLHQIGATVPRPSVEYVTSAPRERKQSLLSFAKYRLTPSPDVVNLYPHRSTQHTHPPGDTHDHEHHHPNTRANQFLQSRR